MDSRPIIFRIHAIQRMFEWGISAQNVRQVLQLPQRAHPRKGYEEVWDQELASRVQVLGLPSPRCRLYEADKRA